MPLFDYEDEVIDTAKIADWRKRKAADKRKVRAGKVWRAIKLIIIVVGAIWAFAALGMLFNSL